VISDITGTCGRSLIAGLIVGETDPAELARRAHPRLRASPEELRRALHGRVAKQHSKRPCAKVPGPPPEAKGAISGRNIITS
jgi:hypothetical protein